MGIWQKKIFSLNFLPPLQELRNFLLFNFCWTKWFICWTIFTWVNQQKFASVVRFAIGWSECNVDCERYRLSSIYYYNGKKSFVKNKLIENDKLYNFECDAPRNHSKNIDFGRMWDGFAHKQYRLDSRNIRRLMLRRCAFALRRQAMRTT